MTSSLAGMGLLAQQQADPGLRLVSDLGPSFPVIWTISLGILLGVAVIGLIYCVAALTSRKAGLLFEELIFDGLLKPVFYVSLLPAAIALLLLYFAPVREVFRQVGVLFSAVFVPGRWSALRTDAPDAIVLVWSAGFVLGIFLVGLLLRLTLPKVAAVAYTTAKEGMAQPLFWVCVGAGTFLLLVFVWLPYSTFGEDIKMLKIQGLELLAPLAILLAVATASVSVAQEVEGRTALTVLSKPIGRRQFIIGKFLGVVMPVLVMFLVLGFVYLGTVSYKTVYEALENGRPPATAVECRAEVVSVVPALVLRFMEAVVMAAISVAISTRLPMLANFAICAVIYVVGHLAPLVVQSAAGQFDIVQFMGQLIATVLPVLENYDVQAGITANNTVPLAYLLMAGVYCLCYCTFVLMGALFLFEDRDLA
jgi:ABC-type transport system involved in multi-copper enzyme maturation permease subunit